MVIHSPFGVFFGVKIRENANVCIFIFLEMQKPGIDIIRSKPLCGLVLGREQTFGLQRKERK